MAQQLIAAGSDVESLKAAVGSTSGDGIATIEIDVRDSIPYFPDARRFIVPALPSLDRGIEAIPGHHVVSPSTYTVQDGVGTLRIQVRTNPVPFLAVALVAVVVSILGIASVIGWRIFKASGAELVFIIIALGLLGVAAVILLRRFGS